MFVYLFSLLTGAANKTDSRVCDAAISKELEGGKPKHPRKGEWKQLEQTRRTNKAICKVEGKLYLLFPLRRKPDWGGIRLAKKNPRPLGFTTSKVTSYPTMRGFCKQYIWQGQLMSLMLREECNEWQAYLQFKLSFPYHMFSLLPWPVDEIFQVVDILCFLCL